MKNKYLNINQKYTSNKTSVNHIPKLFKAQDISLGPINLDYGCGKYADNYFEILFNKNIINLQYDPYNQPEHRNYSVLNCCKDPKFIPDTCTLSNVLNVIKEKSVRIAILNHIKSLIKDNGKIYISCYRGVGNTPNPTCNGWQNNKPLVWYLPEVQSIFPNAKICNNYIKCINKLD